MLKPAINGVDRPQELTISRARTIKRNNFRGPEETETAKVIARRVIHGPHGNVSLFLSFSLFRDGTKEVTESSKIIIRSRRIIYSRTPRQKSRITKTEQLIIIRDETILIRPTFSETAYV